MSDELSKRSVACTGWVLMPGMADVSSEFGQRRIIGVGTTHVFSAHSTLGAIREPTTCRSAAAFTTFDMDDPGTQGCVLTIIADNNARKSMADALADVRHAMGRGLSFPEALVFVLEACP